MTPDEARKLSDSWKEKRLEEARIIEDNNFELFKTINYPILQVRIETAAKEGLRQTSLGTTEIKGATTSFVENRIVPFLEEEGWGVTILMEGKRINVDW